MDNNQNNNFNGSISDNQNQDVNFTNMQSVNNNNANQLNNSSFVITTDQPNQINAQNKYNDINNGSPQKNSTSKFPLIIGSIIVIGILVFILKTTILKKDSNNNTNSNSTSDVVETSNTSNNSNEASNTEKDTSQSNSNKSNSNTNNGKSFESKRVDKLSDVDWAYTPIDFNNLKWLKSERYGNIKIPANWNEDEELLNAFQDLDVDMEYVIYGTKDSIETIIMMDFPATRTNSEIENTLQQMADDYSLEEWSSETISIDERNAVLIYSKYNGINKIEVDLFMTTEDQKNVVHIALESPDPKVIDLAKTFTFKEVK